VSGEKRRLLEAALDGRAVRMACLQSLLILRNIIIRP
jgi:hypothetical protein